MIEFITTPFAYSFMQRGFLAALFVGVLCSVVGVYIVLRGMAFLGDALAHAILPGVAIAYLFGGNLILGAFVAAVVVALGIGFLCQFPLAVFSGIILDILAIGVQGALAIEDDKPGRVQSALHKESGDGGI